MDNNNIYRDIAERTNGDIYIGVVGPVRTGKSTFIKKFMDNLVIPNINDEFRKERANDELPQSAAGRTIMTTEPKFIPEEAVNISVDKGASFNVRLIDCVGYIVPSAIGYIEDDNPRMVMTPWYEDPIPFNMAAEIGTNKVITEHSTIGLVVTTDGSISDIDRAEYTEAEERVIKELKEINKPFIVIVNSIDPDSEKAKSVTSEISEKFDIPVMAVNCLNLDENKIKEIISQILFCFPVKEIKFDIPKWINSLSKDDSIKKQIFSTVYDSVKTISKIKDCYTLEKSISTCDLINNVSLKDINLGNGSVSVKIQLDNKLFYNVISKKSGMEVKNDKELIDIICSLANTKTQYDRIKDALEQVEATGYGIVMPTIEELKLEAPEIMKQGGRYGVKLKASAPSIHLMKANISTEVSPIVGSEKQSEELVMSLMSEFDEDPLKIWDSNIFGKSLNELVNEGLHSKLSRMPEEARLRLSQTLERLINEGCSGLICIIL